ncbi:MAG TPA: Hsp20/alpha crystallin family protein [Haliangiales bacterium]|nr:Hsp20/alpha crystallin family protein [Haliangiales bacterium]
MGTQVAKAENQRLENVDARPVVAPQVDIYENKDELLLIADMPGVAQADLKIHLDEEEITIEGHPTAAYAATELAREFRQVDYRRSFLLPQGTDRDKVSADLKGGVLRLHLPKSAAVKPRRIEVKVG